MRKRLIFSEAQPKKVQLRFIFFKELKPNRTSLLYTALLTKNDLKNFIYLLLNHIGASCQNV